MRATVTVHDTFSASHEVPGHTRCGKLHGHTWLASVTVEGPISPKNGMVVDHGALATALRVICAELDGRDLGVMLYAVVPVPEGIAGYIHERLLLEFPRIVAITVRADAMEATLEWTLR